MLVSKESAKVIIGGNESSQTLHSAEVITHAAHVEGEQHPCTHQLSKVFPYNYKP